MHLIILCSVLWQVCAYILSPTFKRWIHTTCYSLRENI